MRVLVYAYSCGPNRGSEPGVGWNWVLQIARQHQTWVLTTGEFRKEICNELKVNPNLSVRFYFLDFPVRKFFWIFGGIGVRMHHVLWQITALFRAYRLHAQHKFNLAHHLTFGVNYLPSSLCLLPVPLIWGPIGGGELIPRGLYKEMSFVGKITEWVRSIVQTIYPWIPVNYATFRKSELILVRTPNTMRTIPIRFRSKARLLLETMATGEAGSIPTRQRNRNATLEIISVGRLIHWKAFLIGLKAFARVSNRFMNTHLTIVGDGPERKKLEEFSRSSKLQNRVTFTGQIPRGEVLKLLKSADIFLYPSLRDGGAWSVLEALTFGLPVVCLDTAGPGVIVNDECGIKINPKNSQQTIQSLADALECLISDENLYNSLATGAFRRVKDSFSWDDIGKQISIFYEEAVNKSYLARRVL